MAKKKSVGETIIYHIAYIKERSSHQIVDVMDLRQQLILGRGGEVFRSGPITGPIYIAGPGLTAPAKPTPLATSLLSVVCHHQVCG